ncbi:ribonuclease E/G [Halioglobus japonicus]|uniref:Ribonuclease G n=1 Tax=Halioglobus japonicus TaxID=930805 RepID=A0AAP8MG07_9GAMM|nr:MULTISPECIES: ribonuclease G [Halioglobus]AQA19815.1 ribonuclease E/G [Halioglobus japonicus]KZX59536.1 ribonuclease G [Halioglobus sp. HI00S01]PLW87111.1 ribonuclease G [Halioglobus japonicus]GHD10135.1 axial filament protein [Halioglobus japonicus]
MSEEILVNVTPMETRVAVVDNGAPQDIHIERSANRGIVGNIYAGKVVRVLPGMQAAFVEIGLERTSFIHVSDIYVAGGRSSDSIRDHLHDGKKVIVQVTKEPLGTKGARLTTELSVSSRYLVFMPQTSHVGVSQRIDDAAERERLQALLAEGLELEDMAQEGGYILRTAAEGAGLDEIRADLRFLKRLWKAVTRRAEAATKAELLYTDLPLHMRTVRDLARPGVSRILVDSRESFTALQEFCSDYVPEVSGLLEHYPGERPLFDLHGIEDEIQRALGRKVELKSGGYLIIDQTEAMTTIDVNTGSFVGRRNLEETIYKTNLEAATMLARQLRVRNLGGIIIVDFIDMRDEEHRRQVHRTLEKAMQKDPARNKITGVSELGLVEMTRKRTRESLEHVLCEDCPVCQGRGVLKSAETVCYEIFREIMRDARAYDTADIMVLATQGVVDRLLDEESANVADLEEFIGKTISFRVEPHSNPEHFDIVLL